jgi:heme-degrading monooxygenase HmoA
MIARIWRGWVRPDDAAAYIDYIERTGLADYRRTPGNRGAWLLQRRDGNRTEILTLSFWDSYEAIAAFAGADITRARFYPEDDRYLVAREWTVTHHDIAAGAATDPPRS